ncbi:hypothetical protein [Flavobacterium cerinum]|uniref:Uncharacterized protein n=1 Tax=Flavobacterium cerinum TaxID=2502784 RepID=A0ABY5ISW2_9FLAO|nr:hypothetical protein [Flavobacterium cerinum]UUC44853.1 hypothetical protein NOX80_14605 [Flavobacterium cerinum]
MRITQIAVLVSSFFLINTCRETRAGVKMIVKEKETRQLVTETNPAAIQSLIEDTSTEMSLLALNVLHGNHSGNNNKKPNQEPVRKAEIEVTDDDFQNVPPVDTYWLQNLKMSLR